MEWLEVTVNTRADDIDVLGQRLEDMGVSGYVIEDEEDVQRFLEENKKYWDYVDDDFLAYMKGVSRVKFYFEASDEGEKELQNVKNDLVGYELSVRTVRDEDWENNWKAYYKPIEVGKLLVVPQWENAPDTDKKILRLDPGLIFGTGAHPTTRLCLEVLSETELDGKAILDLGCGSGILAIAALLLGAKTAMGVDIDEKAPPIVMENAALNGIGPDRLTAVWGDVLGSDTFAKKLGEAQYPVIVANIVADVIIALSPRVREIIKDGGTFISSGIIEGRQAEVEKALTDSGFSVVSHLERDGWHAFVCRKGE